MKNFDRMLFPKQLKKGETVGIICPSSPIKTERIEQVKKTIENMGYKTKLAENLDKVFAGFMAGDGKERALWINKMFADKEVYAIFCVRGGDGSSRVMEYLDYETIKENPKIFVGYSDVTNLHLAFNQKCGLVSFHGPMISSNMIDDFDVETETSFFSTINASEDFEYQNPQGFDIKMLKPGKATGNLVGGNLSLLSASVGTDFEVETENNILFIEEVSEPMSKIEKWIFHLRNAGKLDKCKGIILGQFTKVQNEDEPEYDEKQVVLAALKGLEIPVVYNVQSGHGYPMMTLPMGAKCTLDADNCRIGFKVQR
ncbi:MAG: LD-carboxypeptidase [Eubacterium sp.]|nr:LD-carboxypeptidase [Eubacterium sp.]